MSHAHDDLLTRFRLWVDEADSAFDVRWGQPDAPEANLAGVVIAQARARDGQTRILMVRRPASIAPHGAWELPAEEVTPDDWAGLAEGDVISASKRAAGRAGKLRGTSDIEPTLSPFSVWLAPPTVPDRRCRWHFATAPLGGGSEVPDNAGLDSAEPTPDTTGAAGDAIWMSAETALRSHAEREIELAPRTWLTLRAISEVAPGTGSRSPVSFFMARPARLGDDPLTLFHGDGGWGAGDPNATGDRHRMRLRRGGWVYERST